MHSTKIGIFKIAQTRVNWYEVKRWLEFLGVKDVVEILNQMTAVSMNDCWDEECRSPDWAHPAKETIASDASALIALCGKRCYNSFEVGLNPNVTKIRSDHAEYVTNILKSGHGSVLEHASWSFAIENISRVFTGEQNRHRAGVAISEASMRYIRFDDIGFWTPDSIQEEDPFGHLNSLVSSGSMTDEELVHAKQLTRSLFETAFGSMQGWNLNLSEIWRIDELKDFTAKKKLTSMFRRIIGMGVSTGGVWTINARALRHILAMRASEHAEEEIYHVFDKIADKMIYEEPLLFGDFEKNESGSWVPKYQKV